MSAHKYFLGGSTQDFCGAFVYKNTKNADNSLNGQWVKDAAEISKEEYDEWEARIAKPDGVNYFSGIFAGIGVIDAKTRKALDKKIADGNKELCKQQCEANRINFKRAQRDAAEFGEDHEAVFTSYNPTVSEDVKAMLFAELRATQAKKGK